MRFLISKVMGLGFFISLLIVGSAMAATPSAQADEIRVGVVDMQKAIQSVEAGKNARSQLESDFNKKKQELSKEEAEIKKMQEELQKQSLVMNEKALAKKQADFQGRVMKFREKTAMSQMELQKKEQELTKPIVDRLRSIISSTAKEKGYTVILEKNENSVLFSQEKDDLTEEVIKRYNKS